VKKWLTTGLESEAAIPTGFSVLDQFLGGGFRSELVFLLADAGVGKSTGLINIGAHAALHGARVLHITFELSANNTLRRYARRVSETTNPDVRNHPELVVDGVNHWLRFAKGSVQVLYYQPYTVGSDELAALVDQYVQLHGGVDLVILDYLDLMKPDQGVKSEYEGLGRLSHRVRGTGLHYNCTMLSATQATRGAHYVRHLRLDMMGDSYNKVRAADIIIGFVQTLEEFEANQARLALLKNRENPGRGVEIPIYVNMDVMLMADLDSANTRRIMGKFQHPTQQVFQHEQ
jgi:replicative DNA helicase